MMAAAAFWFVLLVLIARAFARRLDAYRSIQRVLEEGEARLERLIARVESIPTDRRQLRIPECGDDARERVLNERDGGDGNV